MHKCKCNSLTNHQGFANPTLGNPALDDSPKSIYRMANFYRLIVCTGVSPTSLGKKQPLTKAVDRVELAGDVEGLMAAVQARRARHILPRLSADGSVEYALVLPKPGQRRTPQLGSGADLDWVLNGGRVHSSRSDVDLTDNAPQQRRMVSAGKGRNKLPWERSALSVELQTNGKSPDQVSDDIISIITHTPEISRAL